MRVLVREMNSEEFDHFSRFSFENFVSELARSAGRSLDDIKAELGGMPPSKRASDIWLTILLDDKAIGYLWVEIKAQDCEAFGWDIYIDEEFRSKGIGRQAMEACKQVLMGYGVQKVKICVFSKNAIARKLYDSLGFREFHFDVERAQHYLEIAF